MKLLQRAKGVTPTNRGPYKTPFPVELWFIILTEAVRPPSVLDTHCFSSNMEEYYQMIAGDIGQAWKSSKDGFTQTSRSLRLVCRQFNQIIDAIPKGPSRWVLVEDNEPHSYRAPIPRLSVSGKHERIDLRIDFETTERVAAVYFPVTIFRLYVRRKSQPSDPLYELAWIRAAVDIIPHPERLSVLHLRLDFCYCLDPEGFARSLNACDLTTLSICMGTSNLRSIVYETLSLPNLRVLFLEFPVYGVSTTALQSWTFASLGILSLNLRIVRHGVDPVPSMPDAISSFIKRHGTHLHGLRLLPGLWSRPRNDVYLLPMEIEAERELWSSMPHLNALSTDFTHFPVMASETIDGNGSSPFRNITRLNQLGTRVPSILILSLNRAIEACGLLQELHVPFASPSWFLEALSPWDKTNLQRLKAFCSLRNVSLVIDL